MVCPPSRVVGQINVGRIASLKAKDNAPVSRNIDGIETFVITFKQMEPKAGQIHIDGSLRLVERVQDAVNPAYPILVEPPGFSLFPKSAQALVFDVEDHEAKALFVNQA
jgi:hypothetical protein